MRLLPISLSVHLFMLQENAVFQNPSVFCFFFNMLTLSLMLTMLKVFLGLGTTSFSSGAYCLVETMAESKLAQI